MEEAALSFLGDLHRKSKSTFIGLGSLGGFMTRLDHGSWRQARELRPTLLVKRPPNENVRSIPLEHCGLMSFFAF